MQTKSKIYSLFILISLSISIQACGGEGTSSEMEEKLEKLNSSKKALEEKEKEMDEALEELENS